MTFAEKRAWAGAIVIGLGGLTILGGILRTAIYMHHEQYPAIASLYVTCFWGIAIILIGHLVAGKEAFE